MREEGGGARREAKERNFTKELLIASSPRRRGTSKFLSNLDSRLRGNDKTAG